MYLLSIFLDIFFNSSLILCALQILSLYISIQAFLGKRIMSYSLIANWKFTDFQPNEENVRSHVKDYLWSLNVFKQMPTARLLLSTFSVEDLSFR